MVNIISTKTVLIAIIIILIVIIGIWVLTGHNFMKIIKKREKYFNLIPLYDTKKIRRHCCLGNNLGIYYEPNGIITRVIPCHGLPACREGIEMMDIPGEGRCSIDVDYDHCVCKGDDKKDKCCSEVSKVCLF